MPDDPNRTAEHVPDPDTQPVPALHTTSPHVPEGTLAQSDEDAARAAAAAAPPPRPARWPHSC